MSDDLILPFALQGADVRGKIVRLGDTVSDILNRHDYPQAVSAKLAEAVVLAALLGSSLKFDGKLILQTSSDGPLGMMVVDFTTPDALRGYARFEERGGDFTNAPLLGKGHLALTVDQGADMERYQGVVALQGDDLALAADEYFARSEQIPTRIQLCAGPIITAGSNGWRAGGIMIQHMPGDADKESSSRDEDWSRAMILLQTVAADELLDPQLPPEKLLYRLFHEEGVRVFDPQPLKADCGCSEERVRAMLAGFSKTERGDMLDDGNEFAVKCEFCGREYKFAAAEFE